MPTGKSRINHFPCVILFILGMSMATPFLVRGQSVIHFKYVPSAPLTADFSHLSNNLLAQFSDQSSGQVISWNWDFGDGNTDTLPNPTHVYDSSGIYTVCLQVLDAYGCRDTLCDTVDIILNLEERFPIGDLILYPNPASSHSNLDLSLVRPAKVKWQLLSPMGNIHYQNSQNLPAGKHSIPLPLLEAALPPGIYILQVFAGQSTHSLRLLIRKEAP